MKSLCIQNKIWTAFNMRVHNIYIKQRLDEKLTAKEEFDLTEIYGSIIQSLHETAKEGKVQKTKP